MEYTKISSKCNICLAPLLLQKRDEKVSYILTVKN